MFTLVWKSTAMLYRPAFCCNCGEKIQRTDWGLFTSRRFCPLCETEHKGTDSLPRVLTMMGIVMTIFGVAAYLRQPANVQNGEQVVRSAPLRSSLKTVPAATTEAGSNVQTAPQTEAAAANEQSTKLNEQPNQEKNTSEETVYYCNAITKKGTPCTRRVKTKGYCWQHARTGRVAPARF